MTTPDGIDWGTEPTDEARERRLSVAVESERIRREARRIVTTEEQPPVVLPTFQTLRERLAQPVSTTPWRICGWQPKNSRVMLAAQFKAGKTTARDNCIRSLVDDVPFLGRDVVEPIAGSLVLIDLEMSDAQSVSWLRAQGIRHDDRVIPVLLRGRAATFNLLDADVRRDWAARLRAYHAEYLVLDCLRPVLDALGLDEQREAGRFLVALDALLAEADIPEALLIHHMGHTNERARGDSRLRDWPDVEWRLVRRDEDPASARYITAYGRDVDIAESQLTFDPETRHLTIGAGSRRDAASRDILAAVQSVLAATSEPLAGRPIKRALGDSGHSVKAIDEALRLGVREGVLLKRSGANNSQLYSLSVSVFPSVSPVSRNSSVSCFPALRERNTETPSAAAPTNQSSETPTSDESLSQTVGAHVLDMACVQGGRA